MRCVEHSVRVEKLRSAEKISVRKPERKRTRGKHRHSWGDNIKTDLGVSVVELNIHTALIYLGLFKDVLSTAQVM
jgi:hypothetical protein